MLLKMVLIAGQRKSVNIARELLENSFSALLL